MMADLKASWVPMGACEGWEKWLNESDPWAPIDEAAESDRSTGVSGSEGPESERGSESGSESGRVQEPRNYSLDETVLIFDWDDTVLPSSWVQEQGLRLDSDGPNDWQRARLSEVAQVAAETLRLAKQLGTVVLVTNAERGWIELSCQKFMPMLYPSLEGVKLLSARTTYERPDLSSPLDWKLLAFGNEIKRIFGQDTLLDPTLRKNILSLGDSMHEREALHRATSELPRCCSKSMKFIERPAIEQLCKEHSLLAGCFSRIVQHEGSLDLCIKCS